MLTIEAAKDIAAEYGLTLCDHCEQPREQHTGFDHGQGKCLLATDGITLSIRYHDKRKRHDVIERINAYNAAYADAEQAELFKGSDI